MSKARGLLALLAACASVLVVPTMPSSAATGPQLALTQNGKPNAAIVWWSRDDSPTPQFAASELARYVAKMSGAALPVHHGTLGPGSGTSAVASGVVVATGGSASQSDHSWTVPAGWVQPGAAMLAGADNDAFAITTMDDDKLVLDGSDQRGTLYAAYELLKRLGVRFFAPQFNYYQGNSERVPQQATVATPPITNEQAGSLTYRRLYVEEGWSHNATNLVQLIDWMAKARVNVLVYPYNYSDQSLTEYDTYRDVVAPELAKRGMVAEVGGHGFTSWLPPDRYPQYYEPGYNVFDITNDQAVQQYVDNVIAYLKARPEIQIFDAWPPDGATWPPNVIAKYGSLVNAEAYVVQQLTKAVKTQLPGVRIEEIAYVPATDPPDPEYMYDATNNIIDIAPYDRSYQVPIYDHSAARNAYYDDLIKKWRSVFGGDIGIYEYYRKYAWHSLPCDVDGLVGQEVPYYQSIGADGLGMYSEPADWLGYEALHAEVAALSWNTHLDPAAWQRSYLADRFGSGAAVMGDYLGKVEDGCRAIYINPGGQYGNQSAVSQALGDFQAAQRDAATAAAAGGSAGYVAQRLDWAAQFAVADTQISYYANTSDPVNQAEATQRTKDLVTLHRFDGVVLQNSYSSQRSGDGVNKADIQAMYRAPAYGFTQPGREVPVAPGGSSRVDVAAQSVDYLAHTVRWTADPPAGITVTPASGSLSVEGPGITTAQVQLSAAAGMPEGNYQIPVSFTTDNGTTLPGATIDVVVARTGNLKPFYDNIGITNDTNPGPGNIDGDTCSFSAQALAGAGVTPGGTITDRGITYTWPDVPAGTGDNVQANGQPIAMPAGTSGSTLGFLGVGAPGNTEGVGTIDYTDGSTQYFVLGFPDWQQKDGDGRPVITGYDTVATMSYHNCVRYNGVHGTYVFTSTVPLQSGKDVAQVNLPSATALHIFDLSVG